MENAKKMSASEPANLDAFAGEVAGRLSPVRPDSFFRSALKERLARSKIYARRKAAGALSVIWLIAALVAVVVGELIYLAASGCRKRGCSIAQR
jgi:hypothetical protein